MDTTIPQDVKMLPSPVAQPQEISATSDFVTVSKKEPKEREVAYTINDKYFKGFEVLKSANAWWMDRTKVEALIQNLKNGYNQLEARIHAGISERELRYFKEIHPSFCQVIEACEMHLNMVAETGNMNLLYNGDGPQIRWFLERRKPEKYGRMLADGAGAPVINNFGTIINTPRPVPPSVAERLKQQSNEA